MTREEMKAKIEQDKELFTRLTIFSNLGFALIDVVDAYFCEVESALRRVGMGYNTDIRRRTNMAHKTAKQLRGQIGYLLDMVNKDKDKPLGEEFHEDFDLTSDFLYDMILLLADRVGNDGDAGTRIRAQIYNNPTKGKYYELLRPSWLKNGG